MESIPLPKHQLHIVLVEPEIPQNTGNIARTCAATSACLHLVEPMGFRVDDAKLKRAGLDYWHLLPITYYPSLKAFFEQTCGPYVYFSTKAARIHSEYSYPREVYLVFGKETSGLPEELLRANRENAVRLPMIHEARSLNLSNAVAVAAYEALRQWGYPGMLQCSGALEDKLC
ncbi:MAG: tRNA (cytidine(34)-2'-O)-methyltransferase [Oscillospiraceae bacterium]|nr:tRNA (cytidine(34)-2'-O)-methyltransferase [Oscillospiraceae bacterium]